MVESKRRCPSCGVLADHKRVCVWPACPLDLRFSYPEPEDERDPAAFSAGLILCLVSAGFVLAGLYSFLRKLF